jgi:hypothetical protein
VDTLCSCSRLPQATPPVEPPKFAVHSCLSNEWIDGLWIGVGGSGEGEDERQLA